MGLIVKKRHHQIIEYIVPLDDRQAVFDLKAALHLKPAGLYETMGPHWKNIYWIAGRPYVCR